LKQKLKGSDDSNSPTASGKGWNLSDANVRRNSRPSVGVSKIGHSRTGSSGNVVGFEAQELPNDDDEEDGLDGWGDADLGLKAVKVDKPKQLPEEKRSLLSSSQSPEPSPAPAPVFSNATPAFSGSIGSIKSAAKPLALGKPGISSAAAKKNAKPAAQEIIANSASGWDMDLEFDSL
jgi:hypothetical protein